MNPPVGELQLMGTFKKRQTRQLHASLTRKACLQADGAHLVRVSRIAVAVWAIIMGIAMCIAQVAGINVNWLVLLIGEPLPAFKDQHSRQHA